jgi:hypothetical protein
MESYLLEAPLSANRAWKVRENRYERAKPFARTACLSKGKHSLDTE